MRTSTKLATAGASILLILLPAGAAGASPGSGPHPLRVSGPSLYAGCTIGAGTNTVNYPNAEVEPQITTNRFHPDRVVGAWQQDRWNDGGAHGIAAGWSDDGGRSFHEVTWPVSACAPGGVDYQRASDPWVSTGPDGIVYGNAISFDETTARNAVVGVVSYDGGRTWRNPTAVIADTEVTFFNDKNSVTADAVRPGRAYQVWDRLQARPDNPNELVTGPTWMSVTSDGGRTWSPARIIVQTAPLEQTIGNVIVSDPRDGTLYDFYTSITFTDETTTALASVRFQVVRSFDAGRTWSTPSVIAPDTSVADVDPNDPSRNLRTGAGLPEPAIDPRTGELYVTYEGSDFTAGAYNQIQLVHSTDRGHTWSAPVRVNGDPASPAYTPTVAVDRFGNVGVSYYDIRTLRPGNTTTLPTSTWLTVSPPGGTRFGHERQLAPVFDFLSAPDAGGAFLGDYQGLTTADGAFRALFVTANSGQPNNRTDVFYQQVPAFARPADATDTAASAQLAAPATARPSVVKPALRPDRSRG